MALSVVVADDLGDVGADELYELDANVGALGCRGRLVQHSDDPRWEPRYVIVRDGSRLCAAVPVFLGLGTEWSDQIHSPKEWGLDESPIQAKSALVGGRLEIRGSLRCVDEPEVFRSVLDGCASISELDGRELFLGYLDERQQRLAEAIFGPMEWLVEYDDFVYPEEIVLGSLADVPRNVRQTIRHGERQIAEHQIKAETVPWQEYRGTACALIAEHNKRMGMVDHPALVRYRMDQWDECDEVSVSVVHATAGGEEGAAEGAVTLLTYRDELEVYEVGLPGEDGPGRRALYACLTFHEPRRIAQSLGVKTVRAGLDAGRPKRLRGAQAVTRRCGRALRPPL
ncbi:hypothetical protein DQ384_26540 [Sphaerisporangium album]|uniref:Uncharacterized protein n=1 Tax=Sphaerisporangium album TaxID=509200 RepID=A0A367FC58_9ACTN|nr:hypothetical protein [Sphaerisporangium album]RCG27275.1 hypothetical protein DQ384_26540 [Sphaerisporangium album]